jgi:glycosyltransferase involved in cell wall biosynthesis
LLAGVLPADFRSHPVDRKVELPSAKSDNPGKIEVSTVRSDNELADHRHERFQAPLINSLSKGDSWRLRRSARGLRVRKPRVCIITQLHLSMNPRAVKEADALTEAGYDVEIIAADFSKAAREADAAFIDRPWRVVANAKFGPSAPWLIRSRELLRRGAARLLVSKFGLDHPFIMRPAWHPSAPDLVAATRRVEADLYIAHYVAALPAAAIAARSRGVRYAFDAEDFHLGDAPEGEEHELGRRMTRSIESRYLSGSAYVTAASPGIAHAYRQAYGIRLPTVVLNVFPRVEGPDRQAAKGSAEPAPSIYWFSQTIGPERGLECAVRGIGIALSRPHLYLRGKPAVGFIDRLRILAAEVGAADRLHILAPAPPPEMAHLAALYDLGFAGEPGHTQNRRVALTNKLFTYLLAGVPIVASAIPAHVSFANELGDAMRLFAIDDAAGLAATLDEVFANREALSAARAAAFALGQTRFNWDLEKLILLEQVSKSLAQFTTAS